MKLVIVESPAKTKTISKYLGKGFVIKASVGHVRDLPKSNKDAVDIEAGFVPKYVVSEDKKKVISDIKRSAKKADEVILATDPDREGEAIAWHVAQEVGLKKPTRVIFHEITKEAILEAMKHPRKIDENLKVAQEARRVLDRLFGYDLSGLIWKKVRYGLSAGRVQSPAMRIIMEKEREIRAFVPETFWVITADVQNKEKVEFLLTCIEEPRDKKLVDKILKAGKKESWTVANVKETKAKRRPYAPFITSTLQQVASNRLGFAPFRTMGAAQKLYETGLITYMRTDSTTLSANAQKQIATVVKDGYGNEYYESHVFAKKSKNAQEAHEAIRPSNFSLKSAGKNPDQKKLYQLIWRRAVASQMKDAQILRTKILVNLDDQKLPAFAVKGSRVMFDGWLKADPASRGDDVEVPKVEKGEKLKLIGMDTTEKETQPPSRYTEAGLIKELEKRGIGRPSTYAPTIRTIKEREYVTKEGNTLFPTDTGDVVSTFLEEHFKSYISDVFTAEMENDLDDIAAGKKEYTKILKKFYTPFTKDVKSKEKIDKLTDLGKADKKYKCPDCGGPLIIKLGKTGKFMSCAKFPDCTGGLTIEGKEMAKPKELKEKCPKCESPLLEKEGRFGKFIACSNYPKCKFIKSDPKEEARRNTGVKCPVCGEGEMSEKMGRFGKFYACSNYPKCKNTINAKPTGKICNFVRKDKGKEKCGALMMEGTKTIPERCSDKKCPNNRPDRLEKK